MKSKQLPACCADFVRCTAATAAVEYAVCMGLIIGAVLVAAFAISGPLQGVFSHAVAVNDHLLTTPTNGISAAAHSGPTSQTADAPRWSAVSLFVCLGVIMAGVAPIVTTLWLVRRRGSVAEPDVGPLPIPVPKELQAKFVAKRQAILQYLSADTQQLAQGQMMARQIMSTAPLTKFPHDDVHELRTLMKESVIRHLMVCTPDGKLVGVVSDRDIHGNEGEHVSDIMTPNPITVTPETPVGTVTTIMLARRINCVPVVDQGRLKGIITTSDLLMALQCVLRLIEQLSLPLDNGEAPAAAAAPPDDANVSLPTQRGLSATHDPRQHEPCDARNQA